MFSSKKRLGLAFALVALIALLLWKRDALFLQKSATATAERDSGSLSGDSSQESRRLAFPRPKLTKSVETDPETPAALHFRNFFIRSVHLDSEQGITLAEAVARVKAEYFKTAKETKEESLSLTVDLSQSNTTKALKLKLPRGPLTSVLKLLAAASGNRLVGTGPDFRMEAFADDGRKLTKTFSMKFPPNTNFDASESIDLDSLPEVTFESYAKSDSPDLKTSLEKLGIQLSPDLTEARGYEPGKENIQISNATASDLELMEAALTLADTDALHQQIKLTSKIIRPGADFQWPEDVQGTIDEARFQALIHKLAQTQGTDLMTAPSITARYGQLATLEIVQGSSDPSSSLWSGTQIRFAAQPLGTGTEDSFHLIQSTPNAERVSDDIPLPRVTASGSGTSHQNTVQVTVVKDPDGANVIYAHSSQRIDLTGRLIDSIGTLNNPP